MFRGGRPNNYGRARNFVQFGLHLRYEVTRAVRGDACAGDMREPGDFHGFMQRA
jgi:hypothetical protein